MRGTRCRTGRPPHRPCPPHRLLASSPALHRRCLAALAAAAEHDTQGNLRFPQFQTLLLSTNARVGLQFIITRMGAAAAAKPSTSDEKQRQKLIWFVLVTMLPQFKAFSLRPTGPPLSAATSTYYRGCICAECASTAFFDVDLTSLIRCFQDKRTGPSAKPCVPSRPPQTHPLHALVRPTQASSPPLQTLRNV
jgi:hypothetical protein